MTKGLRAQLITIVTAAVVALSVAAAAGSGDAGSSADLAADGPQPRLSAVDNCERRQLKSSGTIKVPVPDFCRDRLCRLNLLWKGDFIGALDQGFGWGADFIQFNRGWWAAGPAVSIAGWGNPSDGLGRNGDGVIHSLFYGGTMDGSYIQLLDDLHPFENGPGKFVLELSVANPFDPAIEYVQFWACALG